MTAESTVVGAMKLFRRRQVQWYWKSDLNTSSMNEKDEWTSYSDVESEIIEDAFKKNCKASRVELDDWWIDLDKSIAISKHHNNKQTPIKREPIHSHQRQRLRQERFCGIPESIKPFNAWTHGGYWFIKQWKDKQSPHISNSEIIEQAANGIITEGRQIAQLSEAQYIARELLDYKDHDEVKIYKCSLQLYTMESFLYKLVNTTLRKNDKSKINTLGPYCYLLYHSWYIVDDRTTSVVYRGATLDPSMIEHYKNAIGQQKCWFAFTSTSKNPAIAEGFGQNTLFIIDKSLATGLEISEYSEYPGEEEVLLLPGTKFEIKSSEYDEQQKKHHIHIQLLPKNISLQNIIPILNNITEIKMDNSGLDNIDIEIFTRVLKHNQTLKTLHLQNNQISAKGARSLSDALKVNHTVTTLNLAWNTISDEGAKTIGDALKVNQSLTTLDFTANKISDEGAKALGDALQVNQTLTTLYLQHNHISMSGAESLGRALKVNKTLTTLYLRGNQISNEGAGALGDALEVNQTLTTLHLQSNQISHQGAKSLSDALKVNQRLTTLDLEFNRISDKGAKSFGNVLKVNQTLTVLILNWNHISVKGAKSLAYALTVNQTLTALHLNQNQICDEGARAFGNALRANQTLTTLNINENHICDEGAKALSDALKLNQTITNIDLQYNEISNEGAEALRAVLKVNQSLSTITIRTKQMSGKATEALARASKPNQTPTIFGLPWNRVSDEDAKVLGDALKVNKILTALGLRNTEITAAKARLLADALKVNQTLTVLVLNGIKYLTKEL